MIKSIKAMFLVVISMIYLLGFTIFMNIDVEAWTYIVWAIVYAIAFIIEECIASID